MLTPAVLLAGTVVLALAAVAYTYAGYPVVVWALARLWGGPPGRPAVADADLPTVSLVVAAYNEAAEIRARVENALAADYPAGKYEVVIASDGSDDGTAEIADEYAGRGVRVLPFRQRRGKAAVLNDAVPDARGEVVVLSDANTHMSRDAVRQLAAWFADPAVGAVCGRLVLTDPAAGRNVDGLYWKYETFLKKCESRLGALLGSNGGIYAVRRDVYVPIPPATLVDDFVIPLLARQRFGSRIVYDRDAVACEETPASLASEFHRRARIGAGGFQSIGILRGLLHPRHGWVAFTFVNHKVLRWVGPFLLLFALLGNAALVGLGLAGRADGVPFGAAAGLLALQVGFYACSMLGGLVPARPRALRVLRLPAMFTMMNAALAVGFVRWARGRQKAAWKRTARATAARPAAPAADYQAAVAVGHGART